MITELQATFDRLRGSSPHQLSVPILTVLSAEPDGSKCVVELRFQTGKKYCCAESGCSLPTWSRDWWMKFLDHLRQMSQREPTISTIEVRGLVEPGALLFAFQKSGPRSAVASSYVTIATIPDP